MSPLQQSLVISGSIFLVVMASQLGRREYAAKDLLKPLLMCAGFGFFYLKDAPMMHVDYVVYAVGAVIGVGFGLVATATTRIEQDSDGTVRTVCGLGFVSIWLAAVAVRVVFISLAEHDAGFRAHLGSFMMAHQIMESAIPPFFVLMALAMVLTRVVLVAAQVQSLSAEVSTDSRVMAA